VTTDGRLGPRIKKVNAGEVYEQPNEERAKKLLSLTPPVVEKAGDKADVTKNPGQKKARGPKVTTNDTGDEPEDSKD
jgi:hypothetical protein